MANFPTRRDIIKQATGATIAAGLPTIALAASAKSAALAVLVEAERKNANLPGLGAAIVSSKGLQSLAVAGFRAWPTGPKILPGDQWHLGSCTKAITATLAARLIEQKRLRWDSTIGELIRSDMDTAWRKVPLLWLLSHRSGASMNFDQDLWERMVARGGPLIDQRRFFVTEVLKQPPQVKPGSQTLYSNAGFMIAGAMIEAATRTPWERLVKRDIFDRLGMQASGFGPPGRDQPSGHIRAAQGGWQPAPAGASADNPAATGPAGTVHCSLADWARFTAAHLNGFKGRGSFLSPASWNVLHRPAAPDWNYSPGWQINHGASPSDLVLQHLGSNGYWVAQATLFPARDRAVLIVTNVADEAAEPVFSRLLERLKQ